MTSQESCSFPNTASKTSSYSYLWSWNTPSAHSLQWAESCGVLRFSGSGIYEEHSIARRQPGAQTHGHQLWHELPRYCCELHHHGHRPGRRLWAHRERARCRHQGNTSASKKSLARRERVTTFQFSSSATCHACRRGCMKMKSGAITPSGSVAKIVRLRLFPLPVHNFDSCAPPLIDIALKTALSQRINWEGA